jgi:hypothetical protein
LATLATFVAKRFAGVRTWQRFTTFFATFENGCISETWEVDLNVAAWKLKIDWFGARIADLKTLLKV